MRKNIRDPLTDPLIDTAFKRSCVYLCKARRTLWFLIVLYNCCLSDCRNMIMSHCGISVVINVRLYDSQDVLKMNARKKTYLEFNIINLYTFSDYELHYTRGWHVGYHEKYMNGGNTGIFKKNSVSSTTHPHENSGSTGVYHSKGNIS